jgi:hypothetical protein
MKKTSIELLEAYFTLNCNNIHIPKVIWEDAKELQNKQAQNYAEFCIKCDRENLPIIYFEDWIKFN